MKKILLLISILFISLGAKAQGNLQFNAVKRFSNNSLTVAYGATVSAGSITVPADKVWKIESGSCSTIEGGVVYGSHLSIGNQLLFSHSNAQVFYHSPPIWLPAGTYSISIYNSSGGAYIFKTNISAIEFNIIP